MDIEITAPPEIQIPVIEVSFNDGSSTTINRNSTTDSPNEGRLSVNGRSSMTSGAPTTLSHSPTGGHLSITRPSSGQSDIESRRKFMRQKHAKMAFLEPAQRSEIAEMFAVFDTDGSGTMGVGEVKILMYALGIPF
jgi:hypothetical protein